jgi:hypothetical protein
MSTEEPSEIFRLKSTSGYLWGLFMFAGVAAALGLFAFSGLFWRGLCFGAATVLAGGGLVDFLFFHLRLVMLTTKGISVARGRWGQPKHYALADVVEARLQYTEGGQSVEQPLLQAPVPDLNAPDVKHLSLVTRQGDTISLSSYGYDYSSFRRLAAELWGLARAGRLRLGDPPTQAGAGHPHPEPEPEPEMPESEERRQIAQALADCQAYLANDRALAQSLRQNLYDAHASVYRPHLAPASTDLGGLPVAYAGPVANGQVAYFLADDFLPDASLADRELAQNLIATAREHLALVGPRIETYEKMVAQFQQLSTEQERRDRLRQLAGNLDNLQQSNLDQAKVDSALSHDLLALDQWLKMTATTDLADDLARAEVMKQYAELLRGHFGK